MMPIDKEMWQPPFTSWPSWPCPNCRDGRLQLVPDTLQEKQTGPSERGQSEDDLPIEAWDGRFVALFVCGGERCKDIVAVSGRVEVAEEYGDGPDGPTQEYVSAFVPTAFYRAPPHFPVPKKCPEDVTGALRRAFALYWSDLRSCANGLRVAVELLLDDLRVQKQVISKGKRASITLHDRLLDLQQTRPDVAGPLMAVKWLGNVGSHSGDAKLTADDILGAFEIFEHALDLIYVMRAKQLAKLVSAINKRRGVVRSARTRTTRSKRP